MLSGEFNVILKRTSIGLIRITYDLFIIDKNEMADALLNLPKKGASIRSVFANPDVISTEKRTYSRVNLRLDDGTRALDAVCFCEKTGYLLILHPILSALSLGKTEERFEKLMNIYASNIHNLVQEADSPYEVESARYVPISKGLFYCGLALFDDHTVKNVIKTVLEKIAEFPLKKKLKIFCDNLCKESSDIVSLTHTQYIISEMIAIREQFASRDMAKIHISLGRDALILSLDARVDEPPNRVREYYLKIFCELAALFEARCIVRVGDDILTVKSYIPFVCGI